MSKRFLRYAIAICLTSGVFAPSWAAYAEDNKEFLIKAAFISNFIKFVEWPGGSGKQGSIDICVVGDSPISQTRAVFKAASNSRLTLNLVEEKNPDNVASHCHIAFIPSSEDAHQAEILAALKGQPVLTVSDSEGFADHGGMIGFVLQDNKIRLEINPKTASAAGLRIDAQLLEIAARVADR